MDREALLVLWKKVSDCITDEIKNNTEFASRLVLVLKESLVDLDSSESGKKKSRKSNRREPAKVNPFILLEQGVEVLKTSLGGLNIEELKDIISEYGMDTSKLAMKWKDRNRLINLIVDTTQRRASRGEAFWNMGTERSTNE